MCSGTECPPLPCTPNTWITIQRGTQGPLDSDPEGSTSTTCQSYASNLPDYITVASLLDVPKEESPTRDIASGKPTGYGKPQAQVHQKLQY